MALFPFGSTNPGKKAGRVRDALLQNLLKMAMVEPGSNEIEAAWAEWVESDTIPFDPDDDELPIFLLWWLFMVPYQVESTDGPFQGTIAAYYQHSQGKELSAIEHSFLEAASRSYLSFYEVSEPPTKGGLSVRDLLLSEQFNIYDDMCLGKGLEKGDILFGIIVTLPETSILLGIAPIYIPPEFRDFLADIRKKLPKSRKRPSASSLRADSDKIIHVYRLLKETLERSDLPEIKNLRNTDGEDYLMHTISYEIRSPGEALEALADLCEIEDREDLRKRALLDRKGRVRAIDFTWGKPRNALHKEWDNTILGHLRISKERLTVEVNSRERAERIQREIGTRLGPAAVLKDIRVASVEESIQMAKANTQFIPASPEMLSDPRIRNHLKQVGILPGGS